MQKWEYKFLVIGRTTENWKVTMENGKEVSRWKDGPNLYEYCNTLGDEGWEMVSMTYSPIFTQTAFVDSEDFRIVLKRPRA